MRWSRDARTSALLAVVEARRSACAVRPVPLRERRRHGVSDDPLTGGRDVRHAQRSVDRILVMGCLHDDREAADGPSSRERRLLYHPHMGRSTRSDGGGDEGTRTPDPLLAKEVLSQLSYIPAPTGCYPIARMVGVSGLEPETSALSGQCSNQLS